MTGRIERVTDGDDLKAPPEERMRRVGDFNRGYFFCLWVLEGGIKLSGRSTG